MDSLTWMGIALCLSQSAMSSGLNLAVFSAGRLRLEVDEDFILLWGEQLRGITGSDILGRLLRGIACREPAHAASKSEHDSRHA